jgi:hypothetical protein
VRKGVLMTCHVTRCVMSLGWVSEEQVMCRTGLPQSSDRLPSAAELIPHDLSWAGAGLHFTSSFNKLISTCCLCLTGPTCWHAPWHYTPWRDSTRCDPAHCPPTGYTPRRMSAGAGEVEVSYLQVGYLVSIAAACSHGMQPV